MYNATKMAKVRSQALKLVILQLCCHIVISRHNLARTGLSFKFDAIYQFGDSLSDTGNGIRENATSGLCTDFPYGESFFHYVTGRCSDGLIMADYYAMAFGLPFLNPYLDGDADFSNGADFSVSGASALTVEFLESKNITAGGTNSSLALQLVWFKAHLKSICSSESECRSKLKRSLFLMEAIGGNDYNYAFGDDKSFDVVYELVPDVINAITNGIKDMILLGAVYVVVPTVVPFGCMPCYQILVNATDSDTYDELGCVKSYNEVAMFHNEKLYNATKELQVLYPNATIIYADYYSAIRLVIKNAAALAGKVGVFPNSGIRARFVWRQRLLDRFKMEANVTYEGEMLKLTTDNYSHWRTMMEDHLICKDLQEPIITKDKPQGKNDKEWELMNRKTVAMIRFDENATFTACCGTGDNPFNFNFDEMCGTLGVPVCPNPSERICWDGLHFTQQLYKYVSEWMLEHTIMPRLTGASASL